MKRFTQISIFILFLLGLSAGLMAQTDSSDVKVIVGTGVGYITGGDVAHARDDAIEDALRKGIEQVLGMLLESQTLVENFQLIDDNIMTKTQGYVRKYEVINEQKRDAQLYEVTVRALVSVADIKDDLDGIATLIKRKNTPRMMVMIEEKNIGDQSGSYYSESDLNTAENALTQAFMAKGFRFVDQATIKRNLSDQQAAAILEGNTNLAASLGKRLGAEVVLTGKSFAKATDVVAFGATIRSQQATVQVKAIRTDTGDIIATDSEQGKFSHIDDVAGGVKAIENACSKLSDKLITQILDRWQTDIESGSVMTLNVTGITGYDQFTKFKASLKYYVRGLESVTQRSWDGSYAVLEVVMKGNADDLAKRLSGQDIEESKITVTGMTQNSVTVELTQ